MKPPIAAAVLGLIALTAAQAQTTLINDSFNDLDRTNGADENDTQWRLIVGGSTETLVSNQINVPGGSNYASTGTLLVTSRPAATANPHWLATFNSTTLAVGDSLSLSFTYSSTDTASQASGLRFGFYNSGGTSQSADLPGGSVDALYQDDVGYTLFAPRAASGNVQLYVKGTNATADITNISTAANTALAGTSAITGSTLGSATPTTFTATLQLTRTASGYDYTSTWGGANLSASTTNVVTSTFDTLEIFSFLGSSAQVRIDDVLLTYTTASVPEPSSYVAIAGSLGLVGAVSKRRLGRRGA